MKLKLVAALIALTLAACGGPSGVITKTIEVPGPTVTVQVPGPVVEVPVVVPPVVIPPVTCQVWTTLSGNAALYQTANTNQYLPLTDSVKGDIEIGLQSLNLLQVSDDHLPFAAFMNTAAAGVTNNFSMKCAFQFEVKNAGAHKFVLTSDDGSQLFVNGSLRINNGGNHGMTSVTSSITLPVGTHDFSLRYYEGGGPKGLNLTVQAPAVVQPVQQL